MKSIIVWDLPTRVFHWVLAGSIILALIIIEDSGLLYAIHAICGVVALVLILFRLVWGMVGGEHARFTEFIAGWSTVRRYSLQLLRLAPPRHVGHNPLGGWAIVILIILTFLTAGTGVLVGGLWGSTTARAADGILELFGSLLQIMVFIHIAGVLIDWALTRDNLVAAMWHGRKRFADINPKADASSEAPLNTPRDALGDAPRDARGGSPWLAAIIVVPLIVFGGYVLTEIDLGQMLGTIRARPLGG